MEKAKVAILGGSRGLGAAIGQKLRSQDFSLKVWSRKSPTFGENLNWESFDFSKSESWPSLVQSLQEYSPEILIYCAGGGPFSRYGEKDWKDHVWALNVTFQCPAYLLWSWCNADALQSVRKWIVIGSSVAESRPDPQATMYCAAKHALKGLVESLQLEYPEKDLKLYSAPYMDTSMLPLGAWPRQQDGLVRPPEEVADEVLSLVL